LRQSRVRHPLTQALSTRHVPIISICPQKANRSSKNGVANGFRWINSPDLGRIRLTPCLFLAAKRGVTDVRAAQNYDEAGHTSR
jgi:hypothetical protein